ncbi:MAG: DNA primase [Proteobacteria bacterium]|nr:DNA primase [Pseudomonadota bacterium]
MIEESVIKAVIEQTDIVRLVSEYVQLKKRGGRLLGLCPFHREKTPSFSVNPERGAYYCFGCHEGGSAVQFLMKMENLTFPEAIERLGERLGIEIVRTEGAQWRKRQAEKSREKQLIEVMSCAQAYFLKSLQGPGGERCMQYALGRGISKEMQQSFGLGFSPDSWDGLVNDLRHEHQSLEDARALGLVASRDSGGYYARFRNRLMFPVHNVRGDIIAFGGRILDKSETAKYINSPETEIYTKGDHLYGLYQAKMHITREHCAILVEGNVDVVMMHGYGFCHTVASMGTALTPKQANLLFRHTKKVYLMYDGDHAGRKAMYRALGILLGEDFEGLYAVELPKDDDPDSYLRTYGQAGMSDLIAHAKPLGMWCVQKKCADIMQNPPELRKAAFGELSELLHAFPDRLAQHHYLIEAARFLGQDERRLAVELGMNVESVPRETLESQRVSAEKSQFDAIEWCVVQMVLLSPERYEYFMNQHGIELLQEPALRVLLQEYSALENFDNTHEIIQGLSENSRKLYEKIICSEPDVDEENMEHWFNGAVAGLLKSWASREQMRINYELADAVKREDKAVINALLQRNQALVELMKSTQQERKYFWHHETA